MPLSLALQIPGKHALSPCRWAPSLACGVACMTSMENGRQGVGMAQHSLGGASVSMLPVEPACGRCGYRRLGDVPGHIGPQVWRSVTAPACSVAN